MPYCASCGTRKSLSKITFFLFCTMKCAAIKTVAEYSASPDGFYCTGCGEPTDNHTCEPNGKERSDHE
jgi:hypothetical protein